MIKTGLTAGLWKRLDRELPPSRLKHVKAAVRFALNMDAQHSVSRRRVEWAVALHDCGKFASLKVQRQALRRWRVKLDAFECSHPPLWHAALGSELARRVYGVTDRAVLRAIRYHTTAVKGMTPLDMVVYVADALEPGRRYPGVSRLRRVAKRSLKEAFHGVLQAKIVHLLKTGKPIHPRALEAWNWISNEPPQRSHVAAGRIVPRMR